MYLAQNPTNFCKLTLCSVPDCLLFIIFCGHVKRYVRNTRLIGTLNASQRPFLTYEIEEVVRIDVSCAEQLSVIVGTELLVKIPASDYLLVQFGVLAKQLSVSYRLSYLS